MSDAGCGAPGGDHGCGAHDASAHHGDPHFGDANSAEFAQLDHGPAFDNGAHVRHEAPAHITFDYVPPGIAPIEAASVSEGPALNVIPARYAEQRTTTAGWWRRFMRALGLWRQYP